MRYTVTLDAYIWAETDKEAKEEAKKLAEKYNKVGEEDHMVQVLELHKTPFGTLSAKKIDNE